MGGSRPADEPRGATGEPPPLLGTAPTTRPSRWAGLTLTPSRVWPVALVVLLVVIGSVLPYLSMPYINYAAELAQKRATLFPAAQFVRGVEPLWLPGYEPGPLTDQVTLALTVFNLGPSLQQIGAVVAVVTCAALLQDEVNKFFFWPLHLSGWMLALAPVPLFTGLHLLHRADVSVTLGMGWLPVALAGLLVLVLTIRARGRIDSYGGI